jgi:hypothetical protein
VEEERHDITGASVRENLINKLSDTSIAEKTLLDCLIAKLRKLTEEDLLRRRKLSLHELCLSKLL